jgi:uncharacterized protein YukE
MTSEQSVVRNGGSSAELVRSAIDHARLGFEVEPAALRGAAGSFHSEADVLCELAHKLDLHLASLGPCWGADEVGQRFAAGYQPAADTVLNNIDALSIGLHRIAAALQAVGDNYEQVDQLFSLAPISQT